MCFRNQQCKCGLSLQIAKMGVYFKKKTFTDVSFAGFVTTWTIPRMIYFPFW